MTTLLAVVAVAALVLCSMRELTPEARTLRQLRDAAHAAGWARCTGRALLLAVVPALYVLAAGCWMCWHITRAAGFVLLVIADHLDLLSTRRCLAGTEAHA